MTTLGNSFGPTFEHNLVWTLIFDDEASSRAGDVITANLFNDPALGVIMESAQDNRNGVGCLPSADIIESVLKQKRTRMKKALPQYKTLGRAYVILQKMKKQTLDPSDREYVLKNMKDFITERAVSDALIKAANRVGIKDFDHIVEDIREAVLLGESALRPSLGLEYKNMQKKSERYNQTKLQTFNCPIGLEAMDERLGGGFKPQTLGIIMAPAGRGKTMMLVQLGAETLRKGGDVVHITLEVSDRRIEMRYDANICKIAVNTLFESLKDDPKMALKVGLQIKTRAPGRLFIKQWSNNEATVGDVSKYIRTLKETQKDFMPRLVIVDYADLLKATGSQRERRFELAEMIRALKRISIDFDCCVFTASQTGRNSFSKRVVNFSDVSECLEKVQVAQYVISICQTDVEKFADSMKQRARVFLIKDNITGGEGVMVDCIYQRVFQQFKQIKQIRGAYGFSEG